MNALLEKHPDLEQTFTDNECIKTYKKFDIDGNLIEQWERDDDGNWHDVTLREQLKIAIIKEQEEIARLERQAQLKLSKKED